MASNSTVSKESSVIENPNNPKFNEYQNLESDSEKPSGFGIRHLICLMTFIGSVCSYAMRIDLSMAIVQMVKDTSDSSSDETASGICKNLEKANSTNSHDEGDFNWSKVEQGLILGSFFWGYVITQIPGGMLSEKYGFKWIYGGGMLITAIFHILTPALAKQGKIYLIISRVIQGLGEGVTQPSTHVCVANWSPPLERSKVGATIYAGNQLGTMIAMLLSGIIIEAKFLGGWEGVFYTFGFITIIWFIAWCFIVYNHPADHPWISSQELNYIQKSMGNQVAHSNVSTPWKRMLVSMPFYAILAAQIGNGYGLYTLLTELPTYLSDVLKFDIKENSLLSALPYFFMFLMGIILSQLGDILRSRKILSTGATRKVFTSIGHWIPCVALIGAGFSGCNRILTIVLLNIAVGASGAAVAVSYIYIYILSEALQTYIFFNSIFKIFMDTIQNQ